MDLLRIVLFEALISSQRGTYITECLRLLEGDGPVEGEGVAALPNLIVDR